MTKGFYRKRLAEPLQRIKYASKHPHEAAKWFAWLLIGLGTAHVVFGIVLWQLASIETAEPGPKIVVAGLVGLLAFLSPFLGFYFLVRCYEVLRKKDLLLFNVALACAFAPVIWFALIMFFPF